MAEIVTLDVGGRSYKTTIGTLANSGSAYFQSLIARWMPTDDDDDTNAGVDDIGTRSSSRSNKRQKRERNKQKTGTTDAIVKNIFVDRDPDVFEDILYFMRCNCLKPATHFDPFLLRMILNEAQFFAYDVLVEIVNKRLQDIEQDVKDDISKVPARSQTVQITEDGDFIRVTLKKDEVLYISSAVLAGRCEIRRYSDTDKTKDDGEINGCYLETCEKHDVGDFQLKYGYPNYGDVEMHCISHVGLDQIHCGNIPTDIDFRQAIDMCISKADYDNCIHLTVEGSATWHVHYWVGLPEDIPVLNNTGGGGGAQTNNDATKKRRYIQAMINKKKKSSDDELALTYMLAATHMM